MKVIARASSQPPSCQQSEMNQDTHLQRVKSLDSTLGNIHPLIQPCATPLPQRLAFKATDGLAKFTLIKSLTKANKLTSEQLKNTLKTVSWPANPLEAKLFFLKHLTTLDFFGQAAINAIHHLSSYCEGLVWLMKAGLWSSTQMKIQLTQSNYAHFQKLKPLVRKLFTSYAWSLRDTTGDQSRSTVPGFRNPAFLLGRAEHIHQPEIIKAIEIDIDNVWQATLTHKTLQQVQALDSSITEIAFKKNQLAITILKGILAGFEGRLKIYDQHLLDYKAYSGPVIHGLSFGGRVNCKLEPLTSKTDNKFAVLDLLGVTVCGKKNTQAGVFKRSYISHSAHFSTSKNALVELSGKRQTAKNLILGRQFKCYGLNLAVGGLGQKDWNGNTIVNDGCHGHLYIGFLPPKVNQPGVLQVGLETAAPGQSNGLGYQHNWQSSDKNKSILSAVGGLKSMKIGDKPSEKNHNGRQVQWLLAPKVFRI